MRFMMVVSYKSISDAATATFNCTFPHYYSVALFMLDKQCMCLACESLRVLEASRTRFSYLSSVWERFPVPTRISKVQGDLDEAKASWLPGLREKVASISDKFSENFARIGSVGEVALHEAGEDYHQYAVHIRVKFRDEGGLEVLSASRHSGGEKSVSTIMYLLSLQKITQTPFRIVDEINQGMDQTNERRVFQVCTIAAPP
jgi:chromosome segregation ATPase